MKATRKNLIDQVKAYALAHYADGGWDVIAECWGDEDINEHIGKARSISGALKAFSDIIAVYSNHQADARSYREDNETPALVALSVFEESERPCGEGMRGIGGHDTSEAEAEAEYENEIYEEDCKARGIHESHVIAFLLNRFNSEYGESDSGNVPF